MRIFFGILLFLLSYSLVTAQCPTSYKYQTKTNATGNWSTPSDWNPSGGSVTTGGQPPYTLQSYVFGGTTYNNCYVIPAGETVDIESPNFDIGAGINIVVEGTLVVNGKLNLATGSILIVATSSAQVCCNPTCNNADKINIGTGSGSGVWDGSLGAVSGPASVIQGGTLPIDLLFFKASKMLDKISFSWATASELNFDYFDIEKSSDGKNFQSIATVKGNGTTKERNDYSLQDEKPYIGKNYYRLKSVDFDGYTEYFNVVMVDYDGSKGFSVSPNPSDGVSFTAETNFIPATRAFVVIYTAIGSEVARFEVNGDKSQLSLPVKMESGIYYAKYISGDFTATNRVVVK